MTTPTTTTAIVAVNLLMIDFDLHKRLSYSLPYEIKC